jgi:exo-1,4-beta-D-glucosaminidase
VLDWEKTKGTAYTPQSAFADLTGLARLPRVKLAATVVKNADAVRVTLRNPATALAFMVRLRLTQGKGGEDLTPVFWDDNYVSLLPGEERTLTVRYEAQSLQGKQPVVEVGGWNVEAASLE